MTLLQNGRFRTNGVGGWIHRCRRRFVPRLCVLMRSLNRYSTVGGDAADRSYPIYFYIQWSSEKITILPAKKCSHYSVRQMPNHRLRIPQRVCGPTHQTTFWWRGSHRVSFDGKSVCGCLDGRFGGNSLNDLVRIDGENLSLARTSSDHFEGLSTSDQNGYPSSVVTALQQSIRCVPKK